MEASSLEPPGGVLLTLAYDGRNYSGFTRQSNAHTVQEALEGALLAVDPRASRTRCTSRTDAGVHAEAHPVAFDPSVSLSARGWVLALQQHLPEDVGVRRAAHVARGFDPRADVVAKTYRYRILRSPVRDPLWVGRTWRVGYRLNHERMRNAAAGIVGRHDFAGFRGAKDERTETVRQLFRVEVRTACSDPRLLEVEIAGDGFLYKMVRIIVGSLIDIGRGHLPEDAMAQTLRSKSRSDLGVTAPADGLYLAHVELGTEGSSPWPETPVIIDDCV